MSEEKKNIEPQEEIKPPEPKSGFGATMGKVLFVVVLLALITVVVLGSDAIIRWLSGF